MFTLYNVISQDGFIAANDGSEEFIPDDLWKNFLNLCVQYKTIVMGRKTYQTIQSYESEPLSSFENLNIRKIVVTNDKAFSTKEGYEVMTSLEEVAREAPDALVSSGPTLNNCLIEKHLVGKVIWHRVPISTQEGIKPFKDEFRKCLSPITPATPLSNVHVEEYLVL